MKLVIIFVCLCRALASDSQIRLPSTQSCNVPTIKKNSHEDKLSLILVTEFNKKIKTYDLTNEFEKPLRILTGMLLHSAISEQIPTMIRSLISLQADLNVGSTNGITPLYRALESDGPTEILETLMSCGADPNFSTSTVTLIHLAVLSGSERAVRKLIHLGAKVDPVDKGGKTPLYYAAEFNRTVILELLLEAGADVNIDTGGGKTLLHIATAENRLHLVQRLVDLGIQLNTVDTKGHTPLYLALIQNNTETASFLINKKVDVNIYIQNKTTLLHKAVSEGHIYLVDKLIKLNSNISVIDGDGLSPIHIAIRNNDIQMLNYLVKNYIDVNQMSSSLKNYPISFAVDCGSLSSVRALLNLGALKTVKNNEGLTPLVQSLFQNKSEITNLLLENRSTLPLEINYNIDTCGNKPLHMAVKHGAKDPTVKLLELGANPNTTNVMGETPVSIAVGNNDMAIFQILASRNADLNYQALGMGETLLHIAVNKKAYFTAQGLLKLGVNVNAKNNKKITPLSAAVRQNDTDIIRLLINNGAKIDIKDINGDNSFAISVSNSSLRTVKSFIELGAETEPKSGTIPMERAVAENRAPVIKLLISKGADLYPERMSYLHVAAQFDSVEAIITLLQFGVPVDYKHDKKTALWIATSNNNIKSMTVLLKNGADINLTATHPFVIQGEGSESPTWSLIHESAFLELEDATELLLNYGISIDTRDYRGWTPLHYVVVSNKAQMALLLLEKGADINALTKNGISPLDLVSFSTEESKVAMTRILKEFS